MTADYRIGRGDIRELIIKPNGSPTGIDITKVAFRIYVYEDIFENYMTGALDVMDGTALRSFLPMSGGEMIEMDIGERNGPRRLETNYIVYKMSSKQNHNVDLEYYTLSLAAPEFVFDASIKVSQSFTKPIHEIIRDIVNQYLKPVSGKDLVEVEETKGIYSRLFNKISPMAAIKQCIREAESIDHPASIYVFYETIEGYHFVTIDHLYQKNPVDVFVYDEAITSESTPKDAQYLNNLISHMNFEDSFDLMDAQISGQYRTEVHCFDPLVKSFRTQEYDYNAEFKPKKNDNATISNTAYGKFFSQATSQRFIITDSERGQLQYVSQRDPNAQQIFRRRQDFMARERAVLQQYTSTRLTVSVPGNSQVKAGDTVQIVIPRASDTQDERPLNDRLLAGKYLVSAISHKMNVFNEYTTVMELMRPGYEEAAV